METAAPSEVLAGADARSHHGNTCPSTPRLAPPAQPAVPPAPGKPDCCCWTWLLPAAASAPRDPQCHGLAAGTLSAAGSSLGLEMAVSVTLAASKMLSEGWGEEVLPHCLGTAAQQHPQGALGASIFCGLQGWDCTRCTTGSPAPVASLSCLGASPRSNRQGSGAEGAGGSCTLVSPPALCAVGGAGLCPLQSWEAREGELLLL